MPNKLDPTKIQKVHCNACHHITSHRIVGQTEESGAEPEQDFWWSITHDMLQCCGCEDVVLRRRFSFSENEADEVTFHPPQAARSLPGWGYSLPAGQREVLREIYRSLDAESVRLPMMGARTLIDMLLLDKVGDQGGFEQKLKALEESGFLSKQNRDVLSAALEAGNAASHRGHAPSHTEVNAVMDIVENMLQAAYVFPKMVENLRATTPARSSKKPPTDKPIAKVVENTRSNET